SRENSCWNEPALFNGVRDQFQVSAANKQTIYELRYGRSKRIFARIVPAGTLHRIQWPDALSSAPANLSRCKDAALTWAEQTIMTEHRNLPVARRLKSLNNFWWSPSPIAQNDGGGK